MTALFLGEVWVYILFFYQSVLDLHVHVLVLCIRKFHVYLLKQQLMSMGIYDGKLQISL